MSKFLNELEQYYFDRNAFVDAFETVFSTNEIFNIENLCRSGVTLNEFHLFYSDEEFYIIHLPSGTVINWYKHLGRTNTCNKNGFALMDLYELLRSLKSDIEKE